MPPSPPGAPGRPSHSFKLVASVGFVVVCLGLFTPQLFGLKSLLGSKPGETSALEESEVVAASPSLGVWTPFLFGVLAVAVVGIGVTRYFGKRTNTTANSNLETLASLAIDPRCVVHLVRVGERRLLVGVDWAGVKAVTELPEDVSVPKVIGPERVIGTTPSTGELAELFATLSDRGRGPN